MSMLLHRTLNKHVDADPAPQEKPAAQKKPAAQAEKPSEEGGKDGSNRRKRTVKA